MSKANMIWNNDTVAEALRLALIQEFEASSVSIDSRKIKKGSLFVALKGENFDGNDYAVDALKKGAVACIVDRISDNAKDCQDKLILVADAVEALNKLAQYARARMGGKIIGITGSVGKTSTKEMLKIALDNQGEVYATVGNLNNHYGVPLSLANMPSTTDYGIIEMGMTGEGEIHSLSMLARPDVAIITTVEAVHLEFFTSVAGIAAAKSEIFDGMQENGVAIINLDNPYASIMVEKAQAKNLQIRTFAESSGADYKLISYGIAQNNAFITSECQGGDIDYEIGALGKHLAFNSLAVLAAVKAVGAELEYGAHSLRNFKAQKGRGEVIHVANGNYTVIDDSYNASPTSIKAALENLKNYKNDNHRVIVVLGNMVQLGSESVSLHTELSNYIDVQSVDKVYTVGDLMKNLFEKLPDNIRGCHTNSSAEMLEIIANDIKPGDVLLVKGSNAMKMNIIVDNLTH